MQEVVRYIHTILGFNFDLALRLPSPTPKKISCTYIQKIKQKPSIKTTLINLHPLNWIGFMQNYVKPNFLASTIKKPTFRRRNNSINTAQFTQSQAIFDWNHPNHTPNVNAILTGNRGKIHIFQAHNIFIVMAKHFWYWHLLPDINDAFHHTFKIDEYCRTHHN